MGNTIRNILNKLINFGLNPNLGYLEQRKVKLLNVIVFSLLVLLLFFSVLNIIQGRYNLLIGDLVSIVFVVLPSLYFQYKQKYKTSNFIVVSSFFVFITFFSLIDYDAGRMSEHMLLGACIMPVFLFDRWKKVIIFLLFVVAFYLIKVVNILQNGEPVRIDTYYYIYGITFLIVYVVASYFKNDLVNFNNKLIESNQTKDKLFKIIAHDLKSPFSSLLGLSDLQLKYLVDDNKKKLELSANIINQASHRIFDLTQTLLDWAVTQSDSFKPVYKNENINVLIRDVVELSSIYADAKEVRINIQQNTQKLFVCDKVMTQIAIRNIIFNAIKFSARNSEVFISFGLDTNNDLFISVRDYGVGMTNDEIERILDPAQLYSIEGTEREKGSGIGLKMSFELIKKQCGNIYIYSEKEKGSEFKIVLPKNKETLDEPIGK